MCQQNRYRYLPFRSPWNPNPFPCTLHSWLNAADPKNAGSHYPHNAETYTPCWRIASNRETVPCQSSQDHNISQRFLIYRGPCPGCVAEEAGDLYNSDIYDDDAVGYESHQQASDAPYRRIFPGSNEHDDPETTTADHGCIAPNDSPSRDVDDLTGNVRSSARPDCTSSKVVEQAPGHVTSVQESESQHQRERATTSADEGVSGSVLGTFTAHEKHKNEEVDYDITAVLDHEAENAGNSKVGANSTMPADSPPRPVAYGADTVGKGDSADAQDTFRNLEQTQSDMPAVTNHVNSGEGINDHNEGLDEADDSSNACMHPTSDTESHSSQHSDDDVHEESPIGQGSPPMEPFPSFDPDYTDPEIVHLSIILPSSPPSTPLRIPAPSRSYPVLENLHASPAPSSSSLEDAQRETGSRGEHTRPEETARTVAEPEDNGDANLHGSEGYLNLELHTRSSLSMAPVRQGNGEAGVDRSEHMAEDTSTLMLPSLPQTRTSPRSGRLDLLESDDAKDNSNTA